MDQSHTGLWARTALHKLGHRGTAIVVFWAALTFVYLYVRVPLWNPAAPTLSSLLLAAELFGIGCLALHIFCTWTLVDRRAPAPQPGMTADIFVTTWNEPVEMLRNTLLAAKAVRHAGTIWLLDDGARDEMRKLADELGVAYLSRKDRSHAKAGNLNNALKHSTGDFVAIFDCDHAPSPDFLERTLGYFTDPTVAFVQTPQDFYNIDSFQHRGKRKHSEVWHEQTLFYRVIQPGKDRWNAAFFCGSCAVVRRKALEDIGGFATGTITEDLHTSLKMHKLGWSSNYHAEALAFGLSPSDFEQYQTQRLRWARGAMQVWMKEGFLFSKGLTLAQRLSYLASTSTYFEGWQKAIVYFLPIIVITTGWMPISLVGPGFLALFAAWLLTGMIVNEVVSRGYAKTLWMEEYNFFRYFTFMRATLALAFPINWRFVVTPKGRASDRYGVVKLLPQLLLGIGAIVALVIGSYLYFTKGHLPAAAFAVTLVFLSFDIVLSARSLAFARRHTSQQRVSHRFPIPVPVSVNVGKKTLLLVADDISSDGMMLRSQQVGAGKTISGILHLPNGDLPFHGTVTRQAGVGTVGVQFNWSAPRDSDALNACLYGNTLQWDINSWTETSSARPRSRQIRAKPNAGTWELANIISDGHPPIQCIARKESIDKPGFGWRVVSYRRPQSSEHVHIATDEGTSEGFVVGACQSFDVGGGKVHVSLIGHPGKLPHATSHRHPRWTRSDHDSWSAAVAAE